MELTRVSRQRAEPSGNVAPTGGDADVLALLLGGDQASASAFPATLEAAIAGGEVGDEPIAVDGGDATGDGEGTDDGTGQSIDLALAAALALANALPTSTPADAAKGEAAGAATVGVADATAAAQASVATAVGGGGGDAVGAKVAAQAAVATAPGAAATAAAETLPDADARANADAKAAAAAAAAANGTAADAATTKPSSTATAAATASAASDATPRDAHLAAKSGPTHDAGADAKHGASAGVEPERASFSSGAEEQHGGLDLGSSARHETASFAGEKPAAHASAATVELARGEALPVSHSAPADAVNATSVTSTSTTATGTTTTTITHETAAPRADRAGQHFGAIEPRWGERVADAMRLSSVRGGSEIRLQLEPEGLGHIDVRLHLQGDGVRAVIVAEHESTRALLTSQQQVLHEALQRSDIRLSGFTVDVGTGGGGAASFAQSDGQGDGSAPAGTTGPQVPAGNGGNDEVETTSAALGNGRVSVRV